MIYKTEYIYVMEIALQLSNLHIAVTYWMPDY